jgi:hypothetical protein
MELGPDILALVTRLQGMDPIALEALLRNPVGAPAEALAGNASLPAADLPPRVPIGVLAPPRTIQEKFRTAATDPLLPHYGVYLPPFELVFRGSEEERFADLLSLSEADRPMFVVGVMQDNIPKLVPLWGAAQHLDQPHARTAVHGVQTCFCCDVVLGNLPASTRFECGWLVTKSLKLLHEDVFEVKIVTSPVGASLLTINMKIATWPRRPSFLAAWYLTSFAVLDIPWQPGASCALERPSWA